LFPARGHRCLETTYPECTAKGISFFQQKLEALLGTSQRVIIKAAKTDNENARQASYRWNYHIAKLTKSLKL
jgi:hypothetical protein